MHAHRYHSRVRDASQPHAVRPEGSQVETEQAGAVKDHGNASFKHRELFRKGRSLAAATQDRRCGRSVDRAGIGSLFPQSVHYVAPFIYMVF